MSFRVRAPPFKKSPSSPGTIKRKIKRLKASLSREELKLKADKIRLQAEYVGLDEALNMEGYRKFSVEEILEILKTYNSLEGPRGTKKAWLDQHKLTTAHISIWKRKLKEGKLA